MEELVDLSQAKLGKLIVEFQSQDKKIKIKKDSKVLVIKENSMHY